MMVSKYIYFFSAFFLHLICFMTLGNLNAEYEHILLLSSLTLLVYPFLLTFAVYGKCDFYGLKFHVAECFYLIIFFLLGVLGAQLLLFAFDIKSPCSSKEFTIFLVIQIVPLLALSYFLSLIYRKRSKLSKFPKIMVIVFHLLLLSLALLGLLACMYFFPQKRVTNFVFGYIHGPIYDRWIPLDSGILLARLIHFFCYFFGIVWLIYFQHFNRRIKFLAGSALFVCLYFSLSYLGEFPSQSIGHSALQRYLKPVFEDRNLKIFADSSISENSPKELHRLVISAQIYVEQISKKMNLPKIPFTFIYVYKDDDQKKALFGGGTTDVADVFTPSVHINFTQDFPHPSLKHELVHALLRDHTPFSLGFHPNMVLTEGIAVALAPEEIERSLHEAAAFLVADKSFLDLEVEKIFSPWFWLESGVRAYTLAGSFVKYLLDQRDPSLFLKIYAGRDWFQTYGKSLHELIKEWKIHLEQNFANKVVGDLGLKNLMRQASVWRDHCPHFEATLAQKADTPYIDWRRPCTWKSSDYWNWKLEQNSKDYSAQIQIQKIAIKKALLDSLQSTIIPLKDYSDYWEGHDSLSSIDWTVEKIEILLWQADLLVLQDRPTQARSMIELVMQQTDNFKLPQYLVRAIAVRQKLFEIKDFAYAREWVLYLNALVDLPNVDNKRDPYGITAYLYLRRKPEDFEKYFKSKNLRDLESVFYDNKFLARELLWITARSMIIKEDFTQAEQLLSQILPVASSGRQVYMEELQNLIREMKIRF